MDIRLDICENINIYVSRSTSELRVRLARHKTGLSRPVKYFTDRTKAVLLLWIFYVFFVFAMPLCTSVYMCLVVTCWERLTSWFLFVVSNCEFVTFPLVTWVRCGT